MSKEKIVKETTKYLNHFMENIEALPPDHNQQLLFLIDIFNCKKKGIDNYYFIHQYHEDFTGPAKS